MERRDFEKESLKKPSGFSLTGSLSSIIPATHNGFLAIYLSDGNPLILKIPYDLREI